MVALAQLVLAKRGFDTTRSSMHLATSPRADTRFLQAGIEADVPTLVVLNRDKIEALR
jgi:hypothetical protein